MKRQSGMILLDKREFSASGTRVDFTGLNGDIDENYLVMLKIKALSGATCNMQFNFDGSGNNYSYMGFRAHQGGEGAYNGTTTSFNMHADAIEAVGPLTGTYWILASRSLSRVYPQRGILGEWFAMVGGQNRQSGRFGGTWSNTANNLTSINIFTGANQISQGSYFDLYKL